MNGPFQRVRGCAALGLVLVLAFRPCPATATPPGRVLFLQSHLPPAQGTVRASHVARDGSVMVHGDFGAVDGHSRPGLARLTRSGQVDPDFLPEVVALGGPPIGWPIFLHGAYPRSSFLALQDGTWLHSVSGYPLAYQPTGREARRYDFLRGPDGWADALFETDGILYLARHGAEGPRLEAVDAATLATISLHAQETWPAPFDQAVPAGPGHLWILGRVNDGVFHDYLLSFPSYWFFRVELDGTLDPSFEPVRLPGEFSYRIASRAGGGYRMLRQNLSRWWFWPSPTAQAFLVDLHDADGQLLVTRRIDVPLGFAFLLQEGADGSLLHNTLEWYNNLERMMLVRILPDGAHDPDFRVPMHAPALQVLDDGRIQHSHIHRILPNGSPDPSWRTPHLTTSPDVRTIGSFQDGGVAIQIAGRLADMTQPPILVLGPDRQPDPSFQPPEDLPPALSYHVARDGQSLVLALQGVHEFPDGSKTRILGLLRDGSIDPGSPRYIPHDGLLRWDAELHTFTPGIHRGAFTLHPLSDGGFLVHYHLVPSEVPISRTVRLLPDGSPHPHFSFSGSIPWGQSFLVLSDDRLIFGNQLFAPDGSHEQTLAFPPRFGAAISEAPDGWIAVRYFDDDDTHQLALFDIDVGLDSAFESRFLEGTRIHQVLPLADGQWIIEGDLRTPTGARALVRLRADGRIDPTFRPPPFVRVTPRSHGLRSVIRDGTRYPATFAHRGGEVRTSSLQYDTGHDALLVGGSFTHVGLRPRRGLAWLSLRRIRLFEEWQPLFPFDGFNNPDAPSQDAQDALLADYALGVDPADPHVTRGWRAVPGVPLHIRLPLNPDAVDIAFDLEVSEDLIHWRAPQEGALIVTRTSSEIQIRLMEGADRLFVRVAYRERGP